MGKNFVLKIQDALLQEYQQLSIWYFVSFLFGCAFICSNKTNFTLIQAGLVISVLSILLFLFKNQILVRFAILVLLFFILGITAKLIKVDTNPDNEEVKAITESANLKIEGEIIQITKVDKGARIMLSNVAVLGSQDAIIEGNVRIKIKDKYFKSLQIGQRIQIKACLMPPPSQVIPGGYDFQFYANFNKITAVGFATSAPRIVGQNEDGLINIQKKIYERLTSSLPNIPANFIAALVIGDSQGLERETMQNMRLAGISHILCVSGLHLSLVTLLTFRFFRFTLNCSDYLAHNINIKLIAGILSIIVSYGYLKLTGTQVSATRAFIMCGLASLAIILQRNYHPIRAIATAGLLILAFDPEYALHPSFQLSFLAVLSLIAGNEFYNVLKDRTATGFLARFKNDIITNFCSSLFVGFTTGPIVMHHFHIFSNYSALANIVAIPITTLILMPCAFIFLFLTLFNADYYVLQFMSFFVDIIVKTAAFVVNLKYSIIYTGSISGLTFAVFSFGFLWLMLWQSRLKYYGIVIIGISILMIFWHRKPDFILDIKRVAIGIKNANNKLEIYSNKKFSKFTKEYWSNWFGQKEVINHILANKSENLTFTIKNNKIINIVFKDFDCKSNADLTINYSDKQCTNHKIINILPSSDKTFLFVFCDEKSCSTEFYK